MQMPEDKKIPQYVILMRGGTFYFSPNIPLDCSKVVGVFNCMDALDVRCKDLHDNVDLLSPETINSDNVNISVEFHFDTVSIERRVSDNISISVDDKHSRNISSFFEQWQNRLHREIAGECFDSNNYEFSTLTREKLIELSNQLKSL